MKCTAMKSKLRGGYENLTDGDFYNVDTCMRKKGIENVIELLIIDSISLR